MNTLELKELKDELSKLTYEEKRERNEYLKQIAKGEISGSTTGYASVDKPWFKFYNNVNIDLPSHISIYEFTKKQNEKRSNMIAINYFGNLITYNELFTKIENVAMKFSEMGVKCGDIVTICMPTTPEVAICFYALNKLGAVCDMIDPRSNKDQLDYYLKENGSRMLIVCANYFKVLEDTIEKHVKEGNLDYVINLPITPSAPLSLKLLVDYKVKKKNKGAKKINKVISWDDFLKIKGNIFYKEMIHPRDDALIVHSSGTTSVPKGIVLSNRNVNSIAIQYKNTSLKTDPGSKFLSVIPAFASFGMITSINLPFYLGMENILMPLVNDELFIKAFKKNKINFCLTVPGKFMALARSKKKVDLTGLYGPGAGGYSLDSTKEEEINNYLKKNK